MAESYRVMWSRDAIKNIKDCDRQTRDRIFKATEILQVNPHPPLSKKLKGFDDLFRVRVGDYRVIYRVRNSELLIVVVAARHRRDVYRGITN